MGGEIQTAINDLNECNIDSIIRLGMIRAFIRQSILHNIASTEEHSEDDKTTAKAKFCEELGINNESMLKDYQKSQLLSEEDLNFHMILPLKLDNYISKQFRTKAESRFLERKAFLDQVVYSLIRIEDQGMALELYLQLKEEGASFSELAVQHSDGHEAATRGVIGPCPLGQAHPALVERLRTAQVGEVGEPFQIDKWWIIYRVESFTPAVFDDGMAKQMSGELFEAHISQLTDEVMQKLIETKETNQPTNQQVEKASTTP